MLIANPYTLSVKNNQVTHNDTDIWLLQDQSAVWALLRRPDPDLHEPGGGGDDVRDSPVTTHPTPSTSKTTPSGASMATGSTSTA